MARRPRVRPPRSDLPLLRFGLARVTGHSMEPTLRPDDRLLVHWGGRVRPGGLAVVRLPGGRPLAVKRVVARRGDGWWVQRDNPRVGVDSWTLGALPDDAVLASVVWRLRTPRAMWHDVRQRG